MPGGYKKIKPEDGKQFSTENQPANRGNKPSIKKQLFEILKKDGKITIPAKQVIKVNDDGSVAIALSTQMQMAMKLMSWAMSNSGGDSLKAIQMVMEQVDGKAKQTIESTNKHTFIPKEVREQRIEELLKKRKSAK